ncbi:30S ribosomal protein S13 [Candidatus Woesebacteria bacterium RIFCSPLOWO2_01_FULL_39_23]|uniref:Small ribosomal subunit protein uS13 n=2 Tax=Microgenomates group TaxID=1794810 RepID=A0A0H4TNU6_9BACT|nr:30S ribosomal protein S13, small subunit ribosomal protein S13 [uncultured Microgenomates bacterium Rifle_16ft_4_minimus_37633]OGM13895.1 MAG: 30S ribosomal protein S13 [Candidatus Woesebacteria bacterium RBG_16_40_11]OGM27847.1 MAG: 30S ribosomal protein S13 [Candidatus Woesebacteria bacterium RIFCSPHIGHO2_01_FULL_40_22]OGM36309.1 MAG: 30S ribosomal protein S13 [Candidatus Woesebacteria bacterium RIFCSPHIGHO2_12_FULL_38_9]OGM62269.1 MAG: 30S ribosomal protein S13 [Candidatus Woesebacteria b
MARIAGIELQDKDRVVYALTKIKGIGMSLSKKILSALKIDETLRVKDLRGEDQAKITATIETYLTEGDLIRQVRSNIARLQRTGSYRGVRHSRNLPSRGQRTRHNARTKRGKRKTVGAFKKEALAKVQTVKTETK